MSFCPFVSSLFLLLLAICSSSALTGVSVNILVFPALDNRDELDLRAPAFGNGTDLISSALFIFVTYRNRVVFATPNVADAWHSDICLDTTRSAASFIVELLTVPICVFLAGLSYHGLQ